MADVAELSEANFETEVLQSPQPVLVDFWAPWCSPCRVIAPMVHDLAVEYADQIKVVKINVDESSNLASTYGVNSIPTIMIFKNGDVVDRFVGIQPKSRLQSAIVQATEG
jgi:thioredoxin 1